jgi:hypothetical protein
MLVEEGAHFRSRRLRLRDVVSENLEDGPHPFVGIQFHRDARVIHRLIQPHRIAQEDLLRPDLEERG